jgi:SH3 domain-containing YSC84-like protein 1
MNRLVSKRPNLIAITAASAALLLFGNPLRADTAAERLAESANVLSEIMAAPDKGIPEDLLDNAYCAVIVPGLKRARSLWAANMAAASLSAAGKITANGVPRQEFAIEGGSIGWQVGGSDSDVVMLIMNPEGQRSLLQSKFTLGASAGVAAGPVGRTTSARTDARMRAKILT